MATLAALVLAGCLDNPGIEPPEGQLNFPIATALSPAADGDSARFLYVVSSNFDLRYNAGAVQSYDLEELERCSADCRAPDNCFIVPEGTDTSDASEILQFRECPVRRGEVFIGSFASGIAADPDGSRLFVPVRSDAHLTVVRAHGDGELTCGGEQLPHRCTSRFRRGTTRSANERRIRMPGDPVGLHVGRLSELRRTGGAPNELEGSFLLVAHRGGELSLFLDGVGDEVDPPLPSLVHAASGLTDGVSSVAFEPGTERAWLPSATRGEIGRAGLALEPDRITRSRLFNAGRLAVRGLHAGGRGDLRAVRFDPREEVRRAYLLSRVPEGLIVANIDESRAGELAIEGIVDVCAGPSRLNVTPVTDADGEPHWLGFVSCFDSRELYIVQLDLQQLVGVVREMSGPFDIAVDDVRERLYVSDFRTSVVRVVDLANLKACLATGGEMRPEECSPRVTSVLGRPRAVRELR